MRQKCAAVSSSGGVAVMVRTAGGAAAALPLAGPPCTAAASQEVQARGKCRHALLCSSILQQRRPPDCRTCAQAPDSSCCRTSATLMVPSSPTTKLQEDQELVSEGAGQQQNGRATGVANSQFAGTAVCDDASQLRGFFLLILVGEERPRKKPLHFERSCAGATSKSRRSAWGMAAGELLAMPNNARPHSHCRQRQHSAAAATGNGCS